MWLRAQARLLDEQERLCVVVTEMITMATATADPPTRKAARQILTALLCDESLSEPDRGLIHTLLHAPLRPADET